MSNLYEQIIKCIMNLNDFISVMDEKIIHVQKNYEAKKRQIVEEHGLELSKVDNEYKKMLSSLEKKASSMIKEAESIKKQIEKIDTHLVSVDKYYVKTRHKKMEELKDKKSDKYNDVEDYFLALQEIKEQFTIISTKYTKDILPSVINHLNYIFSSKRKADYEELIILKNTVDEFIYQIQQDMEDISVSAKQDILSTQEKSHAELLENQHKFKEKQERIYHKQMNDLALEIDSKLTEILPDDLIHQMVSIMEDYKNHYNKVNKQDSIINDVLYMGYIDFKVEDFITSKTLISFVEQKLSKLMVNHIIKFPIPQLSTAPMPLLVKSSSLNPTLLEQFVQGIMYSYLTTVPADNLVFHVIDCWNHGNSIEAFFEAKKNKPDLFGEKIYTTSSDALEEIKKLNNKVEYITQNVLGTKYANVIEYNRENPNSKLKIELLVIFDFTTIIDLHGIAYLKNLINFGGKCGICILLVSNLELSGDKYSSSYVEQIQKLQKQCFTIVQKDNFFTYLGLNYYSNLMPSKDEFNLYFSNYILICESLHNRGIVLPKFIREFMDLKDQDAIYRIIEQIQKKKEILKQSMDASLLENMAFPTQIVIGDTFYPKDIFMDSDGYHAISQVFGTDDGKIVLPLLLDLSNNSNFLLEYEDVNERFAKDFMLYITWRFLASIPVTKANICIIDPDKKGGSVLPFLDFRKECPFAFDDNIYTSSNDITNRLLKMNEQIDDIIQNKLGNKYDNILDYNLKTPNKMEVVTLLTIYDFPSGFDDRNMDLLMNILKNGSKCGIFTVIGWNQNITWSSYSSKDKLKFLEEAMVHLRCCEDSYCILPFHLNVKLPMVIDSIAIRSFIEKYTELATVIRNKGISFEDIIGNELFNKDATKILSIPVGIGDEEKVISITFGQGSSHHALVAGATGSGKSTLLHTLIMSAMLNYSPDMLNLYLMDFKGGTEFKIYDSYRLPHIQLLALDALQEFGESILERLVKEIGIRSQKFKAVNASKLADYVRISGQPMPKILVIMDEFQILFNENSNRKVANNCAELVKRIVTEGRSYGIHLLMATQSTKIIGQLTLATGTIEQMRIRVGLKCGDYDARYLFGDRNNAKILDMMKGPIGTAVLNEEYTEGEPVGMRVVYCDDATQRKYLEMLQEKLSNYEYHMQSFEGSKTTPFLDVIAKNWNYGVLEILIGNMIKVAPDLKITFDKRKKHNTLICGTDEMMTKNILNVYMLNILLNRDTKLFCIDGDIILGEQERIYDLYHKMRSDFSLAQNRSDIVRYIVEIYDLYLENKRGDSKNQVVLVVDKLQYLDLFIKMLHGDKIDEEEYLGDLGQSDKEEIPKEEDPFDFGFLNATDVNSNKKANQNINVTTKLAQLIEDGGAYGIHFIITCSEIQTLKEALYYGENHLPRFPERYLFSLNDNDCLFLIDGVYLSNLPDNVVYFTDSVKSTFQVKPFVFPKYDDLELFVTELLEGEKNA